MAAWTLGSPGMFALDHLHTRSSVLGPNGALFGLVSRWAYGNMVLRAGTAEQGAARGAGRIAGNMSPGAAGETSLGNTCFYLLL